MILLPPAALTGAASVPPRSVGAEPAAAPEQAFAAALAALLSGDRAAAPTADTDVAVPAPDAGEGDAEAATVQDPAAPPGVADTANAGTDASDFADAALIAVAAVRQAPSRPALQPDEPPQGLPAPVPVAAALRAPAATTDGHASLWTAAAAIQPPAEEMADRCCAGRAAETPQPGRADATGHTAAAAPPPMRTAGLPVSGILQPEAGQPVPVAIRAGTEGPLPVEPARQRAAAPAPEAPSTAPAPAPGGNAAPYLARDAAPAGDGSGRQGERETLRLVMPARPLPEPAAPRRDASAVQDGLPGPVPDGVRRNLPGPPANTPATAGPPSVAMTVPPVPPLPHDPAADLQATGGGTFHAASHPLLPAATAAGAAAPAVAPQAMPVPVAALPQIAIAVATDPGSGQIDLRLSPEELGRVRMTIHCEGNELRVLILADRGETLDLLRRNGPALLSEFADAGFSRTALDFAQGGTTGGGAARTEQPRPDPADPAAEPLPHWPPRAAAAAGRLDLRL